MIYDFQSDLVATEQQGRSTGFNGGSRREEEKRGNNPFIFKCIIFCGHLNIHYGLLSAYVKCVFHYKELQVRNRH